MALSIEQSSNYDLVKEVILKAYEVETQSVQLLPWQQDKQLALHLTFSPYIITNIILN